MSKSYRLSRIFKPETQNTLILPIDHGVSYGNVNGLENPKSTLEKLINPNIDAILMSEGIAKRTEDMFYGRESPARIIASDVVFLGDGVIHQELYTNVENIAHYGYDCMKLIMYVDRPENERMKAVQLISKTINESERYGIPVLVEPLNYDNLDNKNKSIEMITDGARIAYELGADILKLPHPGDKNIIKEWVNNFDIPIILLGGAMNSDSNSIIRNVEEAIAAGVRGVAIGRNIWQRPTDDAKDMLASLNEVIHNNKYVRGKK